MSFWSTCLPVLLLHGDSQRCFHGTKLFLFLLKPTYLFKILLVVVVVAAAVGVDVIIFVIDAEERHITRNFYHNHAKTTS